MRLNRKMLHFLKANIDFSSFYIVDIIPQNKKDAVVLLAPISEGEYSYFNLQYRDKSHYYGTFESMLEACVHYKYVSKFKAKRIKKRYKKLNIKIMEELK